MAWFLSARGRVAASIKGRLSLTEKNPQPNQFNESAEAERRPVTSRSFISIYICCCKR